jgi:hypothetical protein
MIVRSRAALCVAMNLLLVGTHRASRAEPIESPAELPLTVRTAAAEALRTNPELRASSRSGASSSWSDGQRPSDSTVS